MELQHGIQNDRRLDGKRARNFNERQLQLEKLWRAEKEAGRQGLAGRLRFELLKHSAGFSQQTDDGQIRRLLREAKRLFGGIRAS